MPNPKVCSKCGQRLRVCQDCGKDISDRDVRALRCKRCANTSRHRRYMSKAKREEV